MVSIPRMKPRENSEVMEGVKNECCRTDLTLDASAETGDLSSCFSETFSSEINDTQKHQNPELRNATGSGMQEDLRDSVKSASNQHQSESSSEDGESFNSCTKWNLPDQTSCEDCCNPTTIVESSDTAVDICQNSELVSRSSNTTAYMQSPSKFIEERSDLTIYTSESFDSKAKQAQCNTSNSRDICIVEVHEYANCNNLDESNGLNRINQYPSTSGSVILSPSHVTVTKMNISIPSGLEKSRSSSALSLDNSVAHPKELNLPSENLISSSEINVTFPEVSGTPDNGIEIITAASSSSEISRSSSVFSLDNPADQTENEDLQFSDSYRSTITDTTLSEVNREPLSNGCCNEGPYRNEVQRLPRVTQIHSDLLDTPSVKPTKCTCQYRSPFMKLSPPCYFCSAIDLPPKYRETDRFNWREAKSKLLKAFKTIVKNNPVQPGASTSREPCERNSAPFTISDGMFQEPLNSSLGEAPTSFPSIHFPSENSSITQQESEFHVSETQGIEINVSETTTGNYPQSGSSNDVSRGNNGNLSSQIIPPDPPPYHMEVNGVPPPYSPPTPSSFISRYRHDHWMTHAHRQTAFGVPQVEYCRHCQCSIFYSFLLGTITTVLIFGTETSIPLLSCGIIFFTFLVYMPVIWFLENVISWQRWRSARGAFEGSIAPPGFH